MMNDFLKNILEGQNDTPSKICLEAFNRQFDDAMNTDWTWQDNQYEVIFYRDNLEHIAHMSKTGVLLDYRINLPIDHLPIHLKKMVEERGEIMNTVMRNKGNRIEYEFIYRNSALNRHSITITHLGKVLKEKAL